ncbi:hypothetical protein K504DRAFT_226765 [Pleomassaria siparia CBS 279.74]|uniref:Uncharacterized protein n=1 Tax=Pleomassaria siparia CBS 279.74 TaxID=1314801 RepID=A0A6G1KGK1_9PLEO|nr:hypothetical protein K504DRAFT_226765 [Pleomassaria siparia CBS 279.74]
MCVCVGLVCRFSLVLLLQRFLFHVVFCFRKRIEERERRRTCCLFVCLFVSSFVWESLIYVLWWFTHEPSPPPQDLSDRWMDDVCMYIQVWWHALLTLITTFSYQNPI